MSDTTHLMNGLWLTRYAGPAAEQPDRARWQITCPDEGYAKFTRLELRELAGKLWASTWAGTPLREREELPAGGSSEANRG